jgi:hypothetical protein
MSTSFFNFLVAAAKFFAFTAWSMASFGTEYFGMYIRCF